MANAAMGSNLVLTDLQKSVNSVWLCPLSSYMQVGAPRRSRSIPLNTMIWSSSFLLDSAATLNYPVALQTAKRKFSLWMFIYKQRLLVFVGPEQSFSPQSAAYEIVQRFKDMSE